MDFVYHFTITDSDIRHMEPDVEYLDTGHVLSMLIPYHLLYIRGVKNTQGGC